MAKSKTRKRSMWVEYEIPAPDLTKEEYEEDLYIFAEDLGDMISDTVHDLDPTPDQAAKIYEYLTMKMHELRLFADTDYKELSENAKNV